MSGREEGSCNLPLPTPHHLKPTPLPYLGCLEAVRSSALGFCPHPPCSGLCSFWEKENPSWPLLERSHHLTTQVQGWESQGVRAPKPPAAPPFLLLRTSVSLTARPHQLPLLGAQDSAPFVGCCYSEAQSCPALCDPMDCSTPGSCVLHDLLEFAQIHVRWVSDAIRPSHPLSPASPPCLQSFPASGPFPMSQLFTSGAPLSLAFSRTPLLFI